MSSFNSNGTPKWLRRHASPLPYLIILIALMFLLSISGCSTPSVRPDLPPATLLVKCPKPPEWNVRAHSVQETLDALPEREKLAAACLRRQHRLVDYLLKP